MRPVLFSVDGLDVNSYGASKAVAVLLAGWLLARELRRVNQDPALAWPLAFAAALGGFAGAKLFYLAEHTASLSAHDLGGTGFTWYGGLLGGSIAVLLLASRHRLPGWTLAGIASAPLAFAYAVGRVGCLLAGDGTYGKRSELPWAMSFPHGTVPTVQRVEPTPLYEAIAACLIGILLWRLRRRLGPQSLLALFALLMGLMRFSVEFVRVNPTIAAGLSAAQLWSLALVALGAAIAHRSSRHSPADLHRRFTTAADSQRDGASPDHRG